MYARVSSKEQEKEGYSIYAQVKLLKEFADAEGFTVVGEYRDVETAKQTGRANFGEMVRWLKANPGSHVLVEKTDRLYRNFRDMLTLEDLSAEIHFVKDNMALSANSLPSEKFKHDILVVMAKHYTDNLSAEAKKGMLEKAQQGIWPTMAPLGYRNVGDDRGRRVIEPDPEVAPLIIKLFEWYAEGGLSVRDLTGKARQVGLKYRKSGNSIPPSTVHQILRNRIYMGEFVWAGLRCQGIHQPLVSLELWLRVQDMLEGRKAAKHRHAKHNFAFSRLISCGHCGCSLVGEKKTKRERNYIYYHCTGYKGKCNEPYVREEVLEEKFAGLLKELTFDDEILDWIRHALRESHSQERREHEAAAKRLQDEHDLLQKRIHGAYIDKLDGVIDAVSFENMAAEWKAEQDRCQRDIELHKHADRGYIEEGVRLIELAQNAGRLFEKQEATEKRRLLNFLVSNCSWRNRELSVTLRQPFDLIAGIAKINTQKKAAGEISNGLSENWLPGPDSNQRPIG